MMTLGHSNHNRLFKPNPKIPGGSKPGKAQGYWPWVLKVAADALYTQWFAVLISARQNRRTIPIRNFESRMDTLTPGWKEYMLQKNGNRKTKGGYVLLLRNRAYKAALYSGSSDRGTNHNPETRANQSGEHWTTEFGPAHEFHELHDAIVRGTVITITNWRELAEQYGTAAGRRR